MVADVPNRFYKIGFEKGWEEGLLQGFKDGQKEGVKNELEKILSLELTLLYCKKRLKELEKGTK